jgi:hypothetical protein
MFLHKRLFPLFCPTQTLLDHGTFTNELRHKPVAAAYFAFWLARPKLVFFVNHLCSEPKLRQNNRSQVIDQNSSFIQTGILSAIF